MNKKMLLMQWLVLVICILLWCVKYIAWTTPNNVLYASGYGDLVAGELVLSFVFGLAMTLFVFKTRKNYHNKLVLGCSQILSVGLFLTPIAVIVMAFIAGIFFGA